MKDIVTVEKHGAVRVIRLNNPPVNALSHPLLIALDLALAEVHADPAVGAVVLTGSGRGFSAGGDTKAMGSGSPIEKRRQLQIGAAAVAERLIRVEKPVIAAIHGFAVGAGLSIAIACDVTIVEKNTSLRMGFRDVGLSPDVGAHYFLAEALGVRRAKELIWNGEDLSVEEAVRSGLVNQEVPDGASLDAALALARSLAAGPRQAIAFSKAIFATAQSDSLRRVLEAEVWASAMLRTTPDHAEGIAAQREKRPPAFGTG